MAEHEFRKYPALNYNCRLQCFASVDTDYCLWFKCFLIYDSVSLRPLVRIAAIASDRQNQRVFLLRKWTAKRWKHCIVIEASSVCFKYVFCVCVFSSITHDVKCTLGFRTLGLASWVHDAIIIVIYSWKEPSQRERRKLTCRHRKQLYTNPNSTFIFGGICRILKHS